MSSPSCYLQGRQPGRNHTLFAERILMFWRWCRHTGDGLILACRGIAALGDLGSNTAVFFPKLFLFPFFITSWRTWWAGMALLQQQMHSPLLGTDGESRGVRRAATKRGEAKSKKKNTFKFIAAMLRLSKLCWERLWLAHRNYL